ncbi:MAG TPA: ATP-binding protein, partial [Saprospiraceae bacterium]|nr:ATP-binding protein [Saprospiraceae bacterium]HND88344.1 ATP-binding protein [Saprospiraceae bacterium]
MDSIPQILFALGLLQVLRKHLSVSQRLPDWDFWLQKTWVGATALWALSFLLSLGPVAKGIDSMIYFVMLYTLYLLRDYRDARSLSLALLPYTAFWLLDTFSAWALPSLYERFVNYFDTLKAFTALWMIGFGTYAVIQNNRDHKRQRKEAQQLQIAEARKAELEHLVAERTTQLTLQKETLQITLDDLKAAQAQLVHSEKMASLGELTAGIAHEIQNPLNFVNNFSELSVELAQELAEELEKPEPDRALIADLLQDLTQNQQKINHHGKRASSIVTGMLQHSRTGTGQKEPTDLNALADEYLRLSYHGLRAKDKSFQAKMLSDLDPQLGLVPAVPQDLGRVLLNLINNAFYAVTQRAASAVPGYQPTVSVRTKALPKNRVEIRIRDNGTGIPDSLKAKIFQPFFTTKPTGQGTGLGLSL